jgi:hypothetical protein
MSTVKAKALNEIVASLVENQKDIIGIISDKKIYTISSAFTNNFKPLLSGIYMDVNGDVRLYRIEGNKVLHTNLSHKVKNEFAELNLNDDSLPTTKAVHDLVLSVSGNLFENIREKVDTIRLNEILNSYLLKSEFDSEISALTSNRVPIFDDMLSGFVSKEELNTKLSTISDELREVHSVSGSFPASFNPSIGGIYIDDVGETRLYHSPVDGVYKYLDMSIPTELQISFTPEGNSDDAIPTTKAVYYFVKEISGLLSNQIENNSNSNTGSNSGSNSSTSGPSQLFSKQEVIFITSEFPENFYADADGIYIDPTGETRYYPEAGNEYKAISLKTNDTVNENSLSGTVPTSKAVYDYVEGRFGQTNFNVSHAVNLVANDFDNGFIPDGDGLYLDSKNELRFYSDFDNDPSTNDYKVLSFEIVDEIDEDTLSYEKVPSVYAVSAYIVSLENKIAELEERLNELENN